MMVMFIVFLFIVILYFARHYCKPTAVAVSKDTNTFYVSDGYCNSRIIKYTVSLVAATGKHEVNKLTEWGKGAGPFSITQVQCL